MYVKRVETLPPLSHADSSLAGEQVGVRISRLGLTLAYYPVPKAEWISFPEMPGMDEMRNPVIFAAFREDQIIGRCVLLAERNQWMELVDIRVDPAFRRCGAGKAMVGAALAYSVKQGFAGLKTFTSDRNPVMCQFCEHCGFMLQGMDRMALSRLPEERERPMAQRACQLIFYLQKGS